MAKDTREGASAPDDDSVGYCRPPREHRFRENTIPNPWGRKGKPRPKVDFLEERQRLRIDGRSRWVTRDEALDHALYKEAIAGNVSAAKHLEARQLRRLAAQAHEPDESLSPDQEAAMLRLLERKLRRDTPASDDPVASGGLPPKRGAGS